MLGLRNIFVVVASVVVETGDVGAALKGVVTAAVIDGLVVPFHEVPEKVDLHELQIFGIVKILNTFDAKHNVCHQNVAI